MVDISKKLMDVRGRKGGGKKGGGGGKNAANTLQSNSKARMVDLISEGPIEGLVNGAQSIYFDRTPLENPDGSQNFEGVIWEERKGLPDDSHIQGHNAVEQINSVGVEVDQPAGRVTRTITDPETDAVRVIIRINSLFKVDSKGNLKKHDVGYAIDVQPYGGAWQELHVQDIQQEKTTSPYQLAHRIELPVGGAPWNIAVRRTTPDDTDDKEASTFNFESYVSLKERFTYPHSALIAMEVDAESLGQNAPPRTYHVKGRIIEVPSNYDPETRTYSGIWDGTFKLAFCNNPAWIFYDAVTHNRYGLGEFVPASFVNKWKLYEIAQYCDQDVPSGFNDEGGNPVYEPRFTFNTQMRDRREAFYALQTITRAFRGMGFWSLGQVFTSADMPADPIKLVTPSNVIDGRFSYSNTATKARHTVAIVRFNDPVNHYKPTTELVIHEEGLKRFGWREKRLDFEGCSSRGLARRYGKWVLDTEQNEVETVEYKAGFDHIDVKPGDIVSVLDPRKASLRRGGRIVTHDTGTNRVVLDAPVTLDSEVSYTLKLVSDAGEIVDFSVSETGEVTELDIGATTETFSPGAVFALTGADLEPRPFRIISMNETEENVFQIAALEHDPTKYARVEQGISFDPPPYYAHPSIKPPIGFSADEIAYIDGERVRTKVRLTWQRPAGISVREYVIRVNSDTELNAHVASTPATTFDLEGYEPGDYRFGVQAIDRRGHISKVAETTITVQGAAALSNGEVNGLELEDNPAGTEFIGRDVKIRWQNIFPQTSEDATQTQEGSPTYSHNTVNVYDVSGTLLRSVRVSGERFTYGFEENQEDSFDKGFAEPRRFLRFDVIVHSTSGGASPPVSLSVSNTPPAALAPIVNVDSNSVSVSAPQDVDLDFAGMKVWIEETSGFDETLATPKYQGPSGYTSWSGGYGKTYYAKVGYRDLFDDTYTISSETSVTTEVAPTSEPPSTPTGLNVTSQLANNGMARIIIDWDDNSENWIAGYEVTLTENGSATTLSVEASHYEALIERGANVDVTVAAIGPFGTKSSVAGPDSITVVTDTAAPAVPAAMNVSSGFETIWLTCAKNTDTDLSHYELAVNPSPSWGRFVDHVVAGNTFALTGLDENPRYISLRAVDTSGNVSPWTTEISASTVSLSSTVGENQIIAYSANIKDAVITNAKILDLSAAKIQAGTALANSVTVNGTALGTTSTRAADPAARINAASTQIDPGKIVISGGVSLSDWRSAGDQTKIDGGNLQTNSVLAGSLEISNRALQFDIVFDVDEDGDGISWNAGSITYVDDNGSDVVTSVNSGSASYSGLDVFLYWIKGQASLSVTTTRATAFGSDRVLVATYSGGNNFAPSFGRTLINGSFVKTGTLQAINMSAEVFNADRITAGSMSINRIEVDDLLSIDAANAGFTMGKLGAYDQTTDGVFMGRTVEPDGSTGFGFAASKTPLAEPRQSISLTERSGLKLANANHFKTLASPTNSSTTYTSSQTVDISVGTTTFEIALIGGGSGGGARYDNGIDEAYGTSPGGDTIVELLDGTTVIEAWTASGANGAPDGTWRLEVFNAPSGESTPYGPGGLGGSKMGEGQGTISGENGIGAGSGGGAGGHVYGTWRHAYAGKAGSFVSISDIRLDSYGLADPKLRITIGQGSAGRAPADPAKEGAGGDGANGRVDITETDIVELRGDILLLEPTAQGTFTSGSANSFPDLGAGFWQISVDGWNTSNLDIGEIEINDSGKVLKVRYGDNASFVSSKTPVITDIAATKTIHYMFHEMGPT